VIVLLPFTIQAIHSSHPHEYTVCNTKDVTHFHQHEFNCSHYHQIINQNSVDFSSEFDLNIGSFINFNPSHFYQNLYTVAPQLVASRAPPYFIV